MLPTKGRTVLPNKIFSDIRVTIVKAENLTAKNKISFFGNDPAEQQIMDYSIESIVNGLKQYGLASQNTFWYLQEGPFKGTDGPDTPYFQGFSTGISHDGNTIASGGPGYELPIRNTPFPFNAGGIGATWIFTRDSFSVWKQQQTISYNGYNNSPPIQGWSVSISGDGNTLAIGAPNDSDIPMPTGKVYIYVKSGNLWVFQESLNPVGGVIGNQLDYVGFSVSLSNDGNVLVAGGPGYESASNLFGAVWVFRRSGTSWTQDAGPITSYNININDTIYIGQSVDVSSDGNTYVTSGLYVINDYAPIVFVYTYSNNTWIIHTKIVLNGISNQYYPVSISGDGNTIMLGRSLDNSTEGTVDIFIKTNNVWSLQATLHGSGTSISQGITVSLSYSGDTAAFTGYTTEGSNLWIFNRTDGVWVQNGVAIPTAYTASAKLSGDGKTIVTGSCNTQEIRIYKN